MKEKIKNFLTPFDITGPAGNLFITTMYIRSSTGIFDSGTGAIQPCQRRSKACLANTPGMRIIEIILIFYFPVIRKMIVLQVFLEIPGCLK